MRVGLTENERRGFIEKANLAYARLRENPIGWNEELLERAAWDQTSLDGPSGEGEDEVPGAPSQQT